MKSNLTSISTTFTGTSKQFCAAVNLQLYNGWTLVHVEYEGIYFTAYLTKLVENENILGVE